MEKKTGLDRFTLKSIALSAMLVDHIAAVFLPGYGWIYYICRFIGRMTAPIMCFFLTEGFIHTSSRKKYILRMAIFALIAQPAYTLAFYRKLLTPHFSMISTLCISLVMLCCLEKIKPLWLKILAVGLLVLMTYPCDWGIYAPVMVLGFYLMRERGILRLSVLGVISVGMVVMYGLAMGVPGAFMHCGMIASLALLSLYNGERGPDGGAAKWFFYIFYPAHLYVIYIVERIVFC